MDFVIALVPGRKPRQLQVPVQRSWRFRPPSHPRIFPIPAFDDNYIWLLTDARNERATVVDPGDAAPVIADLRTRGLALTAVLVTHHHRDHVGGLPALRSAYPDAVVYGPVNPSIAGIDRRLAAGDSFELDGFDARFDVLEVPGHTLDHIAFHAARVGDDPRAVLFCGDTLFAAGCGRLFEGSPEQMMASLDRLSALDPDTLVYCAHEYTLSNLRFARAVEPDNAALAEREREAVALRAERIETVPSNLATELATNPFMRWHEPAVRRAAEREAGRSGLSAADIFATVRRWKNEFRS
jgi:hydroxyacylglutathione hydrolase